VALLVAGVDSENGPALFHTDPSGTFVQYEAKAIGAGSEGAQSTLQDKYSKVCCSLSSLSSAPLCFHVYDDADGLCDGGSNMNEQSITLKEAEKLALHTLKQVMEEKISAVNVEIASVEAGKTFRIYSAQELEAILAQIDDGSSSSSSSS
jgi:20S proteasome subunit alpha 5